MAKSGNLMVGFDGLTTKQAQALLKYGEKEGLQVLSDAAPAPASGGKAGKNAATTGTPDTISARMVSDAAKAYTAAVGVDARKTVLNHFGATAVQGQNGIPKEHYPQAMEIFQSLEEFQPPGNADEDDKGGKKGKGKNKDKDKSSKAAKADKGKDNKKGKSKGKGK